jgi:hypothetical protein
MSRLLSALFIAGVRRSSTKVAHSFKSKVSHGIYTRQYSAFGTHNRRTSCNICQLTGLVERALCTTDIAMNALQKRKMQTSSLLEGPQNKIHSQSSLEVSRVYEASNRENHSSKEENSLPLGPITSVSKEPNYESQDISQLQSVLDEQAEGYRKQYVSSSLCFPVNLLMANDSFSGVASFPYYNLNSMKRVAEMKKGNLSGHSTNWWMRVTQFSDFPPIVMSNQARNSTMDSFLTLYPLQGKS